MDLDATKEFTASGLAHPEEGKQSMLLLHHGQKNELERDVTDALIPVNNKLRTDAGQSGLNE
jgi:hypothetical protein